MTEIVAGENLSVLGVVLFLSQTKQPSGQRIGGWQSKRRKAGLYSQATKQYPAKITQDRSGQTRADTQHRKKKRHPKKKTTHRPKKQHIDAKPCGLGSTGVSNLRLRTCLCPYSSLSLAFKFDYVPLRSTGF